MKASPFSLILILFFLITTAQAGGISMAKAQTRGVQFEISTVSETLTAVRISWIPKSPSTVDLPKVILSLNDLKEELIFRSVLKVENDDGKWVVNFLAKSDLLTDKSNVQISSSRYSYTISLGLPKG